MGRHTYGLRSVVLAALAAGLAGCGDGGSDGDDAPPPVVNVPTAGENFAAMQGRLDGLFNTAFLPPDNAIPASGTAAFAGYMKIGITEGAAPVDLTGTARLTADFGAGTLAGSAQDFEGLAGGTVSAYAGTISFADGRIGQSAVPLPGERPNDVRIGYAGTLDGAGGTVILDGTATGKLRGTPIRGLVAASAPGETVTVDGTARAATVTIVAETP